MPKATPKDKLKPIAGKQPSSAVKKNAVKALKELSDDHLECRSYRYHALKKVRMFYWKDGSGKGICRISVCTRCGTQRDDYYSRRGELVDRRYNRPDGYSIAGSGYLTSEVVMRELFARATDIAANESEFPEVVRHLAIAGQGA